MNNNYSVLMSVYAKEKPEYLLQSIDSMFTQTIITNDFVLVCDGPLSKELNDVIITYKEKYKDIFNVIKLVENVGLGKALDIGLQQCKNELVARMDSDDISLPQRCEKLIKLFEENDNLAIAGTNIDEFEVDPSIIVSSRVVPSDYKEIVKYIKRRSPFNHPTVMYKKSEVLRCGGYGKLKRKQDMDLFSRMINMGCYALNVNESLLLFRAGIDNLKRRKSWEYCKSTIEVAILNYKKSYIGFCDLIYIVIGQSLFFLLPVRIVKIINERILRNDKKKD